MTEGAGETRTLRDTVAIARLVVGQLDVDGYKALSCATCGRWGFVGVHALRELLAALLASAPAPAAEPQEGDRRTCVDCARDLPWFAVDEAGKCGWCYERFVARLNAAPLPPAEPPQEQP